MRNTETGEFELVMGNRQLLSGFFIVALLFGVAFAMGYIVGRNSSPSSRAQAEGSGGGQPVTEQRPAASGPRDIQPSVEPPKPEPAATQTSQPASAETASAPAPSASAAADPPPPAEANNGSYWQVMAVKPPEADIVLRTLKDKGFPASLSPGPNNLVRVLVGPYRDRDSLGKAKADLENAGFQTVLKK